MGIRYIRSHASITVLYQGSNTGCSVRLSRCALTKVAFTQKFLMINRITNLILFFQSKFTICILKSIILASRSPRRKKLLEQINLSFEVSISDADESFNANEQPADIVQLLASRKAEDVAGSHEDALIIGADTIVVFKNDILEKPTTPSHAREMLNSLSGKTHEVYTGVTLIKTDYRGNINESFSFFEQTSVTFGDLSDEEIDQYVRTGSPMDKAGAYGIQDDWGALFVERIEGDYNNVVGFPLFRFYQHLKNFAPECLPVVNS